MESVRRVAHIDMDAFYVSVELQRRPQLRGKPVVVSGSGPRAVVTTASYEARRFGVFSAIPAARARRLCPQAIFIPPDGRHYRERSREVMDVLREQADRVEVVGLDEAYIDLTGYQRPKAAARRIKTLVTQRTGLGCSIGLGPNKLVAKVASDADKPDGFLAISREQACAHFAERSPSLIPGIGPKSVQRLRDQGIETLAQLASTPEEQLGEWFGGRLGPHLRRLARFEDDRPIELDRVRKSESRETTFDSDLRGLAALEPVLAQLTAELCRSLADNGRRGRTVAIKVRLDDFSTHTRARSLAAATDAPDVVGEVAAELLRALAPQQPVRLLGVRVAGLDEARPAPLAAADQLALAL